MNRHQRRAAASRGRKPGPTGYTADQLDALGGILNGPPGVHHVHVEHDDFCRMLNGGADCNCRPNVFMRRADGVVVIIAAE